MKNEESEQGGNVQPEDPGTPQLKACTFNVGSRTFSIPLEYVKEITEVPEVFPLPLTPNYVDGIIHYRGGAMPVINIGKILNIDEEQKKVKQLIVLTQGNDKFGVSLNNMPNLSSDFSGEVIDIQKFYQTYRVVS